ncbi:DEAD/DEAH box helicase [Planctomycetales bacterium ZRK34]|nr:DEAD/DEAH box helicase [Planctomycetales bacterium ZRK34]
MGDIFNEDITFADLGLRDSVMKGVDECGFIHPTHIQATLIPHILEGKDVLGQAKTGSGKTATFSLPLLHLADKDTHVQALVLAPTRELAVQITREMERLGKHTPIRAAAVVGGESYNKQIKAIKGGAQIIVGTPGRIMDLNQKGQLSFSNLRWVVLDEIDRMLDIGFRDDIRRLLSKVKTDHQTIFVSATISEEIERLGRQHMRPDAEKISTVADSLTVNLVEQYYVPVQPWDKQRMLIHLLTHIDPALTLIFCRTKKTVSRVAKALQKKDIEAFEIHGDLPQSKRTRIMDRLRSGKLEVLVASDLASRGLDVDGITHVVNYDLPDDPEVYVHRIGRTARAGRGGHAWAFVTPEQGQLLSEIEKLTNVHIEKLEYGDFEPTERPADWKDEKRGGWGGPEPPTAKQPPKSRFDSDEIKPEEADPNLFPGGIVPKGKPARTLGSRFKTRRGGR